MALLDYVTEENATGDAREFYDEREARYAELRDVKGRSLYTELRLHNPPVVRAQDAFGRAVLDAGLVDEDLFEVVMVAVAQANGCDYCAGSHRENLDLLLGMDEETIRNLAEGDFGDLADRDRTVAEFATKCTDDPHRVTDEDVAALRAVGLDDADIVQLLVVIGNCNTANLVVDALNAHPTDLDRSFRY